MLEIDLQLESMTDEDSYQTSNLIKQNKWDSFWGNSYLGMRLDTTLGASLSLKNQYITTGIDKESSIELNEDEWKNSIYYRKNIPYSKGMNEYRSKVLAETYDKIHYQRYLNKKTKGFGAGVVQFAGRIAGNIIDPINFIPFFGAGYKVLRISKIGTTIAKSNILKILASRQALMGAAVGAGEAGVASTLVQPVMNYTYDATLGEERTFTDIVADIALSAAFGTAIGGLVGWKSKPPSFETNMSQLASNSNKLNALNETITSLETGMRSPDGGIDVSSDVQLNAQKAFSSAVNSIADGEMPIASASKSQAVEELSSRMGAPIRLSVETEPSIPELEKIFSFEPPPNYMKGTEATKSPDVDVPIKKQELPKGDVPVEAVSPQIYDENITKAATDLGIDMNGQALQDELPVGVEFLNESDSTSFKKELNNANKEIKATEREAELWDLAVKCLTGII
jgi:hypothetical protein